LEYDIDLGSGRALILRGDANYRGKTPLGGTTETIVGQQDAFTLYNASITYHFAENWSVSAWIKNITDETYIATIRDAEEYSPFIGYREHMLAAPRTWAVKLRYDF
jgi:outer membrane receptor protein involved in Fe transport